MLGSLVGALDNNSSQYIFAMKRYVGHETVSHTITWALYLIGLYPDVQAKIHEELDRIFGTDTERDVTESDLNDLKYLNCVLKETNRLYAVVPMIGRQAEEDMNI
ncbi:probable cytochrome P450 4d20, partial [Nephila pilipes]